MNTATEILQRYDLHPSSTAPGRYYQTCPQCSAERSRAHQRSPCLGITIDDKGVQWGCNHCGWKGGEFYNGRGNGRDGDRLTTYDYLNADGELQFQKVRNPLGHEPRFWCRRPDGRGGWINNTQGIDQKPLYRWPEVVEALALGHTIAIVEGEKDADSLWRIGVPATCNFDGAADTGRKPKWKPEYSEMLRGADIVVLNDNDPPGYAHADTFAHMSLGIAKQVRQLDLAKHWPDIPRGGDISDWLALGHTRKQLDALIDFAPDYSEPTYAPDEPREEAADSTHDDYGQTAGGGAHERAGQTNGAHSTGNTDAGLGEWDAGEVDDDNIPPRGWLLGNIFCRGFVSQLLGDGGIGKTATRYAQYLSLAAGRSLTSECVFQRSRVLLISLEDDDKELRRRIRAARLHHRVDRKELKGWLFVAAPGRGAGKLLTVGKEGRLVTGGLAERLERVIIERRIDLVGLDPFVKSHSVGENDNNAIDAVAQILTDLAAKYDIAVDVPHHISKGQAEPGNASRGRGASSAKDAFRLVYTLSPMSEEEAKCFGLSEAERRRLIRMDSGKVNIAPPMTEAKWFRLVGVPLGNATDLYPHGDEVQTVAPWTPPDKWAGLSNQLLNQILTDIDAGMPDGNRYSDAPNVTDRAAWRVVIKHAPAKNEADAREIVKAWIKSGLLVRDDYENPTTRKTVKGLRVENAKRPS